MRAAGITVNVRSTHPEGHRFRRALSTAGRRFLTRLGISGRELSIVIVPDAEIRELNARWRKKDRATDVLSFPAGTLPAEVPPPHPLGDVVVSLDTARREAARLKGGRQQVERELLRYLAHGVLHLLGYDHHRAADARRMAAAERELLGEEGMIPVVSTVSGRALDERRAERRAFAHDESAGRPGSRVDRVRR